SDSEDRNSEDGDSENRNSNDSNSDKKNIPLTIMLKNLYIATTK
ncbi:21882_t:CDS:1, partial [Dentiscutata erythropus]